MDQDLLGNIPLFAKLREEELAELCKLLKEERVEDQKPVCWIGEEGSDFYLIQVGRVSVNYPDETGREVTIAVLGPGDFFGEISLLDGGPRTATVRAAGEVVLLSLSRHDFLEFLKKYPSAAIHILTVLGQRQREMLVKLRGVKNVNEVIQERATTWQRIADVIAAVSASQAFVIFHVIFFGAWMIGNGVLGGRALDPFPYNLLTMIVSLEAIFLSIFVLVSQNRSGEKDRIRADLDYQVNLRAHLAVMQLHQKIDRMEGALMSMGAKELAGGASPTSAAEKMLGVSPVVGVSPIVGVAGASADLKGMERADVGQ
jgi:CRP/FNR family transcriptional regulator, cyclic AMP receptor protein